MTHPDADRLVLLAYDELPAADAAAVEAHLAVCATCHETFGRLERARVAVAWSLPAASSRAPRRRFVWVGLAAAAALALVLLARPEPARDAGGDSARVWQPFAPWSEHAGYLAGGASVREIDVQLTRLEQERPYGFPN